MDRFVDWFLDTALDVLVGLGIYALLRLVGRRRGMEWAEVFQFLRDRTTPKYTPPTPWAPR